MNDATDSSKDAGQLWGYLIPALGLVAVGVFAVLNGGNNFAPVLILCGLALAALGLVKHERD